MMPEFDLPDTMTDRSPQPTKPSEGDGSSAASGVGRWIAVQNRQSGNRHFRPSVCLACVKWLVMALVWSVAAICLAGEPPRSYSWTAADDTVASDSVPLGQLAGSMAVHLASANQQHIDLGKHWLAETPPEAFTLRIVFRLTRPPKSKCPLVSKWHMTEGGRAFEVGVLPEGFVFFDLSSTGNWDRSGREVISDRLLVPGQDYCLAAVFEPGQRMQIFVNGQLIGETAESVPGKVCENSTPLWLGAQPPGMRHLDALVSQVILDHRRLLHREIAAWAESLQLTRAPAKIESPTRDGKLFLPHVRQQVLAYCQELQVDGKPFGVFHTRRGADQPISLYASADVAWIRACMGEDLQRTLSNQQRESWIRHINSYARQDGSYFCPQSGHSLQHANGMVIGALGVLGGRQPYPVGLYDEFNTSERIEPWLESIRWERQWGASHLFWGGMHCYSLSKACQDDWLNEVFQWLNQNLDPKTGWWRKGVAQSGRRIEVLGGAAHIWPIYQHHGRKFPYPRRIIDEILAMQQPNGAWLSYTNYMELDALYGLAYMQSEAPGYRSAEITDAVQRHGRFLAERYGVMLAGNPTAHHLLAVVGTLGLLQQLTPDDYPDEVRWSDIFSDRALRAMLNW